MNKSYPHLRIQTCWQGYKASVNVWTFGLVSVLVLLCAPPPAIPDDSAADSTMAEYTEYMRLREAGELARALGPARRAYAAAKVRYKDSDETLGITAHALGSLFLELGRPTDAMAPLKQALQCWEAQQGRVGSRTLSAQNLIAEAYTRTDRFDEAERTYLDVIDRYEEKGGDQRRKIARTWARLRKVAASAGAVSRGRRYGLKALNLLREIHGEESLRVGLMMIQIGQDSIELGDFKEGLRMIELGVPIVESKLEPGNPQLTALYTYLVDLYVAAGDTGRERRYRGRLKKVRKVELDPG